MLSWGAVPLLALLVGCNFQPAPAQFIRPSPAPSPSPYSADELAKMDAQQNPWKYNKCFSPAHACRNVLLHGAGSATIEEKACWVHQDEALLASRKVTVMCREPLLKCDCSENAVFCSQFFQQIKCSSEKDLGGLCTRALSNALTFFVTEVMVSNAETQKELGNPKLLINMIDLFAGKFTGHTLPEWIIGPFCSSDSNAFSVIASQSRAVEQPKTTPSTKTHDFGPPIGGGWELVRRVSSGNSWHPATDHLQGTHVYGVPSNDPKSQNTFSVDFSTKEFNQFLFATGDMAKWLIVGRNEVNRNGSPYSANILKSSSNGDTYTALWFNRPDQPEDPWISLQDHLKAINSGDILYGENGYSGQHARAVLPVHQGANVFIRNFVPGMDKVQEVFGANTTAGANKISVKISRYPDVPDPPTAGKVSRPLIDLRPCINDSVDDMRFAKGEKATVTKQTAPSAPLKCHAEFTSSCDKTAKEPQFDDEGTIAGGMGVYCNRQAKSEPICKLRGTPCQRYTDQLPYSTPSGRLPCRSKASMKFLETRQPEPDNPDDIRKNRWNSYMEHQDKQYPPPIDPYIDPDERYKPKLKLLHPRPIAGDNDEPDLIVAANVVHKQTSDIPFRTRRVDMETPQYATVKHHKEMVEGRERDRIKLLESRRKALEEEERQQNDLMIRLRREYRQRTARRARAQARRARAEMPK